MTCDYVVAHVKKVMDKNPGRQIGSAIENMLKTGRLVTQSGLDLQQVCITSGTTLDSFNTNELTVLLSVPYLFHDISCKQNTEGGEVYHLIELLGVIVEAHFMTCILVGT